MTADTTNAVWGTTKTHQLSAGDQVLFATESWNSAGVMMNAVRLAQKRVHGYETGRVWKTIAEVTCNGSGLHMVCTDGTTEGGGVATRYWARKAQS
jgi:hypothetical protein